jgi:hypothetical protein
MKRGLSRVCWLAFLLTLLLWLSLLWHHPDPVLVLLPTGVVYAGLCLYRLCIRDLLTCIEMVRFFFHAAMMFVAFRLATLTSVLASMLDPSTPRAVFSSWVLWVTQAGYWLLAVFFVLLTIRYIPSVEQMLDELSP